jgi:BirA family biotin operon repressor/biotin-[acetyl-CoA-carboxylase] ligase
MFSVALRPLAPASRWGWLPLLAGVAMVNALGRAGLAGARVKWPNDVLVAGGSGGAGSERKLAGILAQVRDELVVVGCGLNVSTTAEQFGAPAPGALAPTSLALEGLTPDRTALLIELLAELDTRFAHWDAAAGDAAACGLAAAYRAACCTLGRAVTLTEHDGAQTRGYAVDIDPDGHLLVEVAGALRTVAAGDVRHARPLA